MQTLTFENFSDFKKEVGFNQLKLQVDGNLFTIVNPSDPNAMLAYEQHDPNCDWYEISEDSIQAMLQAGTVRIFLCNYDFVPYTGPGSVIKDTFTEVLIRCP